MSDRPKQMPLNPDYVVCYTPGKVGSSTIMNAFGSIGIPVHRCNNSNISQYMRKDYPTVTMVRDPIAWAISMKFEEMLQKGETLTPDMAKDVVEEIVWSVKGGLLLDLEEFYPIHFRKATGVQVHKQRWRKKDMWMMCSMRVIVMRTDHLNTVLEPAMREFLPQFYPEISFDGLVIDHRASGDERFENYQEFIKAAYFNIHWLAEYYDRSAYANQFFFRAELRDLVLKWSKRE